MKTLLTIALAIASLWAAAQQIADTAAPVMTRIDSIDTRVHGAGKLGAAGFAMQLAGFGALMISSAVGAAGPENAGARAGMLVIGGALTITGSLCQGAAWSKLKRAKVKSPKAIPVPAKQ